MFFVHFLAAWSPGYPDPDTHEKHLKIEKTGLKTTCSYSIVGEKVEIWRCALFFVAFLVAWWPIGPDPETHEKHQVGENWTKNDLWL